METVICASKPSRRQCSWRLHSITGKDFPRVVCAVTGDHLSMLPSLAAREHMYHHMVNLHFFDWADAQCFATFQWNVTIYDITRWILSFNSTVECFPVACITIDHLSIPAHFQDYKQIFHLLKYCIVGNFGGGFILRAWWQSGNLPN